MGLAAIATARGTAVATVVDGAAASVGGAASIGGGTASAAGGVLCCQRNILVYTDGSNSNPYPGRVGPC